MVVQRQVSVKLGDVLLLVGKGEFILSSSRTRKKWSLAGPFFPDHCLLGSRLGETAWDSAREDCCGGRFYQ